MNRLNKISNFWVELMFAVNLALAAANVGLVGAHVNRKLPTKAAQVPNDAPKTKSQMSAPEKRKVEETVVVINEEEQERESKQKFQRKTITTEEATDPRGQDEESDAAVVLRQQLQ